MGYIEISFHDDFSEKRKSISCGIEYELYPGDTIEVEPILRRDKNGKNSEMTKLSFFYIKKKPCG